MKKLIVFAMVAMMAGGAFAATGWFQDYILVSDNGAADEYYWIGSDPGFGSDFTNSSFQITLGDTFELGADMKYWSDTQDRGGGSFFWTVDNYATSHEVIWSQTYLGGNDYQGLEPTENGIASGLGAGSYTLIVWAKSWDTGGGQGDSWLTNGGANYSVDFTINPIPEPATFGLLAIGAGLMYLRKRRA